MSRAFASTILLALVVLAAAFPAVAGNTPPRPADEVFRLGVARTADGGMELTWDVSPGHYLYRDRISVATAAGAPLPVALPAGEEKDDPTFGATRVFHDQNAGTIAAGSLPASGDIRVTYQGCAEHGICYPPVVKRIDVATLAVTAGKGGFARPAPTDSRPAKQAPAPSGGTAAAMLSGGLPTLLFGFLGFGLLLALTPCVFPMVPILSGMLARSGEKLSTGRGVALSGAYVVAMALAYAALGVVAAWSGQNLQLALQTPLAVGLMSLVFVALALSMFGLFDLALPSAWTARVSRLTGNAGGSLGGAALLGFGSALIVGPCVTPPLAAALLYVAQTGDMLRGAAALFALGLGMGLPLIAFGLFGGRLLPRAGAWLVTVKQVFGVMFLGLAVWMLGRVLPAPVVRGLWGVLAIGAGLWFGLLASRGYAMRFLGGAAALCGALLLTSAVGLVTFTCPLAACQEQPGATLRDGAGGFYRSVRSPAAFDAALAEARAKGQPILVDFAADWCVVCREIDRTVLADPAIRSRLQNVSVLRADVTADTPETRALMQRFHVVGPPTMFFVDPGTGLEVRDTRTVGEVTVELFDRNLGQAGA